MKCVYLCLGLCLSAITMIHAQDPVHFFIGDDTMQLDQQKCIPLRTTNFVDIDAFQFSINFDPYLIRFDSVTNLNSDLGISAQDIGIQDRVRGRLTVIYFDATTSTTLPDSSTLFSMCFTPYGPPTDTLCPINITSEPLDFQVISGLQIVDASTRDGRITIETDTHLTVVTTACPTGFSDTSGTIEVAVYGGVGPYFVLWQNRSNSAFSGGFGLDSITPYRILDGLAEGSYRITVTDASSTRVRDTIGVFSVGPLIYQLDTTAPACDQDATGRISFDSIMGGFSPTQIKWNDGQLFDSERTGLTAGIYHVTLTDPSGCRRHETIDLESTRIQTQVTEVAESCAGTADGSVLVTPTGGQVGVDGAYAYLFEGDTLGGASLSLTGLTPGQYSATAIDTSGCQRAFSWSIDRGLVQTYDSISVQAVGCMEGAMGSIHIRMSQDTGVRFSFSAPGVDSIVTDGRSITLYALDTGSYQIFATRLDSLMCDWDTTLQVSRLSPIIVNTLQQTPASCTPGNDGLAQIDITGGLPFEDGSYRIGWSNGDSSTLLTRLSPGTYTAEIEDQAGCIVTHEINIEQDGGPVLAAFSIQNMRCDTTPAGVILTTFTSPSGIESYNWSTGDVSPSITGVTPGSYSVTVTTTDDCVDSFTFDAAAPPGPVIFGFDLERISCPGDSNGQISAVFSPGLGPIDQILWNGDIELDTLRGVPAGDYVVTLTDINGCTATDMVRLDNPIPISISLSTEPKDVDVAGYIEASVFGGWPPYTYDWSPGNLPDTSFITLFEDPGIYTLMLTDAEGCTAQDSIAFECVSSVRITEDGTSYQLQPNPTSDHVVVTSSSAEVDRLRLIDLQGRIWRTHTWRGSSRTVQLQMHLDGLPGGMYFVHFIHRDGQLVQLPLVVQR